MNDDDQAAFHHDMQQLRKAAVEAICASGKRPLTQDEQMLVAWSAGCVDDVYREIRQ